ncbi:MAG: hypothetical protein U9O20_04965 [Patescibacteria group bacterium]|nr:hypothetical protein [Patescibacteria group bacterium]
MTSHSAKISTIIQGALKRWKGTTIPEFLSGSMKLSDTQWLLSHLFENIVSRLKTTHIMTQRTRDDFVRPCDIDQRTIQLFDRIASNTLGEEYSVIELSPLASIGSNSLLTKIKQANILPTSRMTELVADVAVALSIESGLKYRSTQSEVRVASSHRIVRVQDVGSIPGFTQHFRMFGLCHTGAFTNKSYAEPIKEQVRFYLNLINQLSEIGTVQNVCVYLSNILASTHLIQKNNLAMEEVRSMTDNEDEYDLCTRSKLECTRYSKTVPNVDPDTKKILKPLFPSMEELREEYPNVEILYDLGRIAGIGYYNGPCFKITAANKDGSEFPLVDGGVSDWVATLLHNKKISCVTSGIGSELFCREFLQ